MWIGKCFNSNIREASRNQVKHRPAVLNAQTLSWTEIAIISNTAEEKKRSMFDLWIYSYRFHMHQVQVQTPGKQTETAMHWNEVPIFFLSLWTGKRWRLSSDKTVGFWATLNKHLTSEGFVRILLSCPVCLLQTSSFQSAAWSCAVSLEEWRHMVPVVSGVYCYWSLGSSELVIFYSAWTLTNHIRKPSNKLNADDVLCLFETCNSQSEFFLLALSDFVKKPSSWFPLSCPDVTLSGRKHFSLLLWVNHASSILWLAVHQTLTLLSTSPDIVSSFVVALIIWIKRVFA